MTTSRLDSLRMIDPVLTTVAQGYSNNAFVAQHLFPIVPVSKMKGKIPKFGRDAFTVRETKRAVGAASNRIPPTDLELISYETTEYDAEAAIDYIEEEDSANFWKYEQRITKDLMDILKLGKEKTAADLVQDAANYDSELVLEIEAADAFNTYTNSTDPISTLRTCSSLLRGKIAKYPNTMIIGDAAWQTLLEHPKVVSRIKYSGIGKITKDILSDLLEIPAIHVGMSVYSEDGVNFQDIWQDNIILAYVDRNKPDLRSEFNPSFGYTLQRKGKPEVDSYYENGGKIKVVRATDNYAIKITAKDAAFLIKNTNH